MGVRGGLGSKWDREGEKTENGRMGRAGATPEDFQPYNIHRVLRNISRTGGEGREGNGLLGRLKVEVLKFRSRECSVRVEESVLCGLEVTLLRRVLELRSLGMELAHSDKTLDDSAVVENSHRRMKKAIRRSLGFPLPRFQVCI